MPFNIDTNCYLIKNGEKVILIDTGLGNNESMAALESAMKEIKLSIYSIDKVLITHPHIDHMGLLGKIKQKTNCDIYLPEGSRDFIEEYNSGDIINITRSFMEFAGTTLHEIEVSVDVKKMFLNAYHPIDLSNVSFLKEGEEIFIEDDLLRCIFTYGHCAKHICFLMKKNKLLFSGDQIFSDFAPLLEDDSYTHGLPPYEAYMRSLNDIENLFPEISCICPAHGNLILGLDEFIKARNITAEYYFNKQKQILRFDKNRMYTLDDLVNLTSTNRYAPTKYWKLSEMFAHLLHLEKEEKIELYTENKILKVKLK